MIVREGRNHPSVPFPHLIETGKSVLLQWKLAFNPVHTYNPAHRNPTLAAVRNQRELGLPDPTHERESSWSDPPGRAGVEPGDEVVADFLNKTEGAFE